MTKANPLFVDSTKFHGDSIGTHVELKNVMVYEGEELIVVVTNHQGVSMRVPMKVADERSYEARVHLNHQKPITYQFVVEKDGQLVLQSAALKSRAQYAIIEEWQPLGTAVTTAPDSLASAPSSEPGAPWPGEYAKSVKTLIDKWGL